MYAPKNGGNLVDGTIFPIGLKSTNVIGNLTVSNAIQLIFINYWESYLNCLMRLLEGVARPYRVVKVTKELCKIDENNC